MTSFTFLQVSSSAIGYSYFLLSVNTSLPQSTDFLKGIFFTIFGLSLGLTERFV